MATWPSCQSTVRNIEDLVELVDSSPSAPDAEASLLGSLICDSQALPDVCAKVKPSDFSVEANRIIFEDLLKAYENHKSLDLIIVKETLGEERLRQSGGVGYLSSLVERLPEKPSIAAYVSLILECSKRREVLELAKKIEILASKGGDLSNIQSVFDKLRRSNEDDSNKDIHEAAVASLANIDDIKSHGVDLCFGVKGVDETLGGLRRKNLYVLGAKTSQGKTTVAVNVCRSNLAYNEDSKILYNVFENAEQIPTRLASQISGVPLDYYLKPHQLTDEKYKEVKQSMESLSLFRDRLRVVQNAGLSRLQSITKSWKPDIIIVDYLQRWAHRDGFAQSDRLSHAVGKAVSDLQDLAIETNSAVICLSQLSRRAEDQRNRFPVVEDLKESGDIENYADVIILLYWPWRDTLSSKYLPTNYNFLIRKNKLGPCLDVPAEINLKTLSIGDWISQ